MIEADTELEQIVAAVSELLGEHEVVDVCVVFAQHLLGVGDQPIQMRLDVHVWRSDTSEQGVRRMRIAAPMRLHDGLRHLPHVLPLIRVGRKRDVEPVQLQVTQPGGQSQDVHLTARVVHVELACNDKAGRIEHVGQAGAERRPAPVADMQRSGRIG